MYNHKPGRLKMKGAENLHRPSGDLIAGPRRVQSFVTKAGGIVTYLGTMETSPLELTQDLGFFLDEGVEVKIEHMANLTEAVVSGSFTANDKVLKTDLAATYTNEFVEGK